MKTNATLSNLFTLGQLVRIKNDDFDVVNGPRFDLGVVTNITNELVTVFMIDDEFNMYFNIDLIDYIYPIEY